MSDLVIPSFISIALVPIAFTALYFIIVKFILKTSVNSSLARQLALQQAAIAVMIELCIVVLDVFKSNAITYLSIFPIALIVFYFMFTIGVKKSKEYQQILLEMGTNISTSAQEVTATSEQITMSASIVNQKANEINLASENIKKQNEILANVLNQINLLSMNATIEAGRMGPEARGFMTVASELQKLYRETRDKIDISSSESLKIVEELKSFAATTEEITSATEEQTSSMEEITMLIDRLNERVMR